MKTTILSLIVLISGTLQAQDAIDKYFSYLDKDTSISKVNVNAKMFELFSNIEAETEEEEEFVEMLKSITSLRMLINEKPANGKGDFNKAISKPGKEFETLMEVDTDGNMFKFLINERDGIVTEFLMIGYTSEKGEAPKFMILSLTGKIDLKHIGKLGRTLQMREMKHLEKVQKG